MSDRQTSDAETRAMIMELEHKQKRTQEERMKSISRKLQEIDDTGDMFDSVEGLNLPPLYEEGILSVYDDKRGGVNSKLKSGQLMTERLTVNPSPRRPAPREMPNNYSNKVNTMLDGLMDNTANRVTTDALYEVNDPASHYTQMNRSKGYTPYVHGNWNPVQVIIESGRKEKVRWSVRSSDGTMLNDKFRHEIVAATVAALLNENNSNVNDPRLTKIIELCDQETSAIKEMNATKKMLNETDMGNTKRRDIYETKISVLREKIETIRIRLGV